MLQLVGISCSHVGDIHLNSSVGMHDNFQAMRQGNAADAPLQILVCGCDLTAPQLRKAFCQLGYSCVLYEREPPLAISPQLIIGVNELELVQQLQRQYQVAAAVWFTDNHNLIYNDPQVFCLDAASCANVYLFWYRVAVSVA